MKTTFKEMKNFLMRFQYLQRNDEFVHNIQVKSSMLEDGVTMISATFDSIIEKDEDGASHAYRATLYSDSPFRWNEAEFMKFKLLLTSDK